MDETQMDTSDMLKGTFQGTFQGCNNVDATRLANEYLAKGFTVTLQTYYSQGWFTDISIQNVRPTEIPKPAQHQ
jgi:hypothetical protein